MTALGEDDTHRSSSTIMAFGTMAPRRLLASRVGQGHVRRPRIPTLKQRLLCPAISSIPDGVEEHRIACPARRSPSRRRSRQAARWRAQSRHWRCWLDRRSQVRHTRAAPSPRIRRPTSPAALVALDGTVVTNARRIATSSSPPCSRPRQRERDRHSGGISRSERAAYPNFCNPASRYAMVGVFVADHGGGNVRVAVTGGGPRVPGSATGAGPVVHGRRGVHDPANLKQRIAECHLVGDGAARGPGGIVGIGGPWPSLCTCDRRAPVAAATSRALATVASRAHPRRGRRRQSRDRQGAAEALALLTAPVLCQGSMSRPRSIRAR